MLLIGEHDRNSAFAAFEELSTTEFLESTVSMCD